MKKLALAFSSKDRVNLTEQTLPRVVGHANVDVFWNDGSATDDGKYRHQCYSGGDVTLRSRVTGGPDRAIVFALSQMLANPSYTHVGLLEQDVLLDSDWLEPTMALFDYNPDEDNPVGAVSARSYCDRVLIQRDGHAIMHNVGAGHVIFTREAAGIILDNYRTGWWPENRAVFSQLSGLDIGKWAAFHSNEQFVTADWSWDTILAAHGLATVALTPSKATMIGQDIAEQGLKLVDTVSVAASFNSASINPFRANLIDIRNGDLRLPEVDHLLRTRNGTMIFPHHAEKHCGAFTGSWTTRWSQGFGPFTYVAGADAAFSIPLLGSAAFHVSGGKVELFDEATGFTNEIDLTGTPNEVSMSVPRDLQYGRITLILGEGACLHGIETLHPQARLDEPTFDYSKLPEVG